MNMKSEMKVRGFAAVFLVLSCYGTAVVSVRAATPNGARALETNSSYVVSDEAGSGKAGPRFWVTSRTKAALPHRDHTEMHRMIQWCRCVQILMGDPGDSLSASHR